MPPKPNQRPEKLQKENASQSNNLRDKKKLKNAEEDSQLNDVTSLQTYFEEQSTPSQKKKPHIAIKYQQKCEDKTQFYETQEEVQCLACLQDDFIEGKYILECRHTYCNHCFKYWNNIANKCPACHKISKSVMMILDGSTRVQAVSPKYLPQNCEICKNNYNEHQIYYCDSCEENCVHTYCQSELMNQKVDQFWVCKECKKQKRKVQGKTRSNFEYCDEEENSEEISGSESMLGRIKKEKNREGPYYKDQRKDIIRKNKDKKGK